MNQDKELTLESLKAFFATHPSLSIRGVNEEAGLTDSYLHKILRGERTLTEKTKEKILPVIKYYGYGLT